MHHALTSCAERRRFANRSMANVKPVPCGLQSSASANDYIARKADIGPKPAMGRCRPKRHLASAAAAQFFGVPLIPGPRRCVETGAVPVGQVHWTSPWAPYNGQRLPMDRFETMVRLIPAAPLAGATVWLLRGSTVADDPVKPAPSETGDGSPRGRDAYSSVVSSVFGASTTNSVRRMTSPANLV